MSGGYFDYKQRVITEIADSIEQLILGEDTTCKPYDDHTVEEFREGMKVLKLAAIYVQRIDWLVSGNDSEDSFHERLNEELKEFVKCLKK